MGIEDGMLDEDGAVVGSLVNVGGLVDGLCVGDLVTIKNGPVGAGLGLGVVGSGVIVGSIVGDNDWTGVGTNEIVGYAVRDGIIDGAIVGVNVGRGGGVGTVVGRGNSVNLGVVGEVVGLDVVSSRN